MLKTKIATPGTTTMHKVHARKWKVNYQAKAITLHDDHMARMTSQSP